jgi:hypothetical protein
MNRIILATIIAVVVAFPFQVLAQTTDGQVVPDLSNNLEQDTQPEIKDVEGLRLELAEQVQDPDTKNITFDIVVYSQIRSDRVQLNWSLDGAGSLVGERTQVSFSVDPGSVKRIPIVVRPRARGISNLRITVEAFEAQGTYLASAFQRIYSLEDGTRLPRTQPYWNLVLVSTVRSVAVFFLYIFGGVLILVAGYGVFQRWLNLKEAQLEMV